MKNSEKITSRIKSSLIQNFFLHFFLFLFLVFILNSVYGNVQSLEQTKVETFEKYQKLEDIKKYGISFQDIQSHALTHNLPGESLLKEINDTFYNQHFFNSEEKMYSDFLEQKKNTIFSVQSSGDFQAREALIDTILPYYTPEAGIIQEGLSDFHFVNYVENILYDFNLNYEGNIGVGNIEKLEQNNNSSSVQENIYFIPLSFRIEGAKSNIIDMLHFFENVGNISFINDALEIYDDNFISLPSIDAETSLYENQFAEIISVTMREYPDSSPIVDGRSFIESIRTFQAREAMQLDIALHFYVAGLPSYKIQEFISGFLGNYFDLRGEIQKELSRQKESLQEIGSGKKIQAISTIESLSMLLNSLNADVDNIRIALANQKNLDELFEQVSLYDRQLNSIRQAFGEQLEVLNN